MDPSGADPENPGRDEPSLLESRVTDGSIPALPKEGPCLMASLQGIAETYAGKNMTAEQKTISVEDLVKSGAIDRDFVVHDSVAVIVDALTKLGVGTEKLDISISRPTDQDYANVKATATASLLHVGRRDCTGGAAHWEEGDAKGVFRWDPISGTDDGGRKNYENETRYVIISKKEDQ